MDSISVFIFTTLEPYLKPLMKTATTGLMSASGEVIDSHDQYEVSLILIITLESVPIDFLKVFNNPGAVSLKLLRERKYILTEGIVV